MAQTFAMPTASAASTIGPTASPTVAERHLLDRFTPGYTPRVWQQLRAAGGAAAWFEQQLDPDLIAEDALVAEFDAWFPRLFEAPGFKYAERTAGRIDAYDYAYQFGCWTMLRQAYSTRGLHEVMTEFWSNHFHIAGRDDSAWMNRFEHDRLLRRLAFGKFADLLREVTLSAAMLGSLDNFRSVRGEFNENHGRELLELHTVTRASGYTEEMVKSSAMLLSGWTIDWGGTFAARYDSGKHTTGRVRVLDFTRENASPDGRADTEAYLGYLARHPQTARNIARKLAVQFVSDTPSEALIGHLAQVYLAHDTDIRAVLRALRAAPEFQAAVGAKMRTPIEDLVATLRVLDVRPLTPTSKSALAWRLNQLHGGDKMYWWPRPDGRPLTNAAWCSSSRMLYSFQMHWNLAGRYYPRKNAVYRTPASWLPAPSVRLDAFVDHLCRTWLGRPADERLLTAALQITGLSAGTVITARHKLIRRGFPRLAVALLDTPDHMRR